MASITIATVGSGSTTTTSSGYAGTFIVGKEYSAGEYVKSGNLVYLFLDTVPAGSTDDIITLEANGIATIINGAAVTAATGYGGVFSQNTEYVKGTYFISGTDAYIVLEAILATNTDNIATLLENGKIRLLSAAAVDIIDWYAGIYATLTAYSTGQYVKSGNNIYMFLSDVLDTNADTIETLLTTNVVTLINFTIEAETPAYANEYAINVAYNKGQYVTVGSSVYMFLQDIADSNALTIQDLLTNGSVTLLNEDAVIPENSYAGIYATGTAYNIGQYVRVNNNIYMFLSNVLDTNADTIDVLLTNGVVTLINFNSIATRDWYVGEYATGKEYFKGQYFSVGTNIYVLLKNIADTNQDTIETLISNGDVSHINEVTTKSYAGVFALNTAYSVGQFFSNSGNLYFVQNAIADTNTDDINTLLSNQTIIFLSDRNIFKDGFAINTAYSRGDIIIVDDIAYIFVYDISAANTSTLQTLIDSNNVLKISSNSIAYYAGEFALNTAYEIGQYFTFENSVYLVLSNISQNNTDGLDILEDTFTITLLNDLAKKSVYAGVFSTLAAYDVGQYVIDNNKVYLFLSVLADTNTDNIETLLLNGVVVELSTINKQDKIFAATGILDITTLDLSVYQPDDLLLMVDGKTAKVINEGGENGYVITYSDLYATTSANIAVLSTEAAVKGLDAGSFFVLRNNVDVASTSVSYNIPFTNVSSIDLTNASFDFIGSDIRNTGDSFGTITCSSSFSDTYKISNLFANGTGWATLGQDTATVEIDITTGNLYAHEFKFRGRPIISNEYFSTCNWQIDFFDGTNSTRTTTVSTRTAYHVWTSGDIFAGLDIIKRIVKITLSLSGRVGANPGAVDFKASLYNTQINYTDGFYQKVTDINIFGGDDILYISN